MSHVVLDDDGEYVGELTDVRCPRCGRDVVYNGNYFCRAWTYPFDGGQGTCDWALGNVDVDDPDEPAPTADDLRTWESLKTNYVRLREFLALHPGEEP